MNDIYYYVNVRFLNGKEMSVRFPHISEAVSYAKMLNFDNVIDCFLEQRETIEVDGEFCYFLVDDTKSVDMKKLLLTR